MGILAECPRCHKKQKVKNKACDCGENLDKAKRSRRVKYWVYYRLPDGKDQNGNIRYKQRKEAVTGEGVDPYSIEDARAVESKRTVQKKEKRFFDLLPEANMTFKELAEWYLSLEKVKALRSFKTVQIYVNKFNQEFGDTIVNTIKPAEIENLQAKRIHSGLKPKTVDDEVNYTKGMIIKAFDNDLVGGDVLKTFRRVQNLCKGHSNRRERVLTCEEFRALYEKAPDHIKGILAMAYWTGMRKGEIINLTWDKVDLKTRLIRLEASDTKEGQAKTVPISEEVFRILRELPSRFRGGHVFLYSGRPIEYSFLRAMKTACDGIGITWGRKEKGGFIFHDLRHTFITDMRRAGVARTVTMRITGHAIRDMNERYDTVDDSDMFEAIRMLEKLRNASQSATQAPNLVS